MISCELPMTQWKGFNELGRDGRLRRGCAQQCGDDM